MHLCKSKRAGFLALGLLILAAGGIGLLARGGSASEVPPSPIGAEITALQGSFRNSPDDSKIMVRWWWFGPAVTTEELSREMQQMKDAGIGGFEVATVYPLSLDDPGHGLVNLRYLSPQHLAAVSSTARTAHELGLRMDMTMGSGWPFGGPYITSDLAAERLLCLRIPIAPGAKAIPVPQLQNAQRLVAAFVASGDMNHFDLHSAQQVARQSDGSIALPSTPSGPRVLLVFVAGLTGQQVKRAAVGAEGNVLDHYNRAAVEKHMDEVGAAFAQAGEGNIRAMFCDSLEVYESDWTADFLKEFQRRRGYDLVPDLPALVAGTGLEGAAVRHDRGQTLTELFNERFLAPYQSWCRQHHVLARVQAYGTPPAQLSSYRYVDLPEGEQGDERGHWNDFTASRWASSAGHDFGQQVISAEAWTWIHALPFRATPLDFKAYADQYFLEGINQLVGHGWPYSPPGVAEPGWHLYAAGAINPHNPWWFAMPDLARYLQRASFILRQGGPANDVAVYLPTHDAWASLTPGHVNLWEAIWRQLGPDLVPSLLEAGYNLDFFDDEILAQQGRIENGKLAIANQKFPIVVLPGIDRIPPSTLAKLSEFARSGGSLVATRRLPSLAPGYLHQESEGGEVRRQVYELFKKPSAPGHFVPDERAPLEVELAHLYPPDVALSPRSRDIGFIHRHTDAAEIYFIANTSNRRVQATATFRVKGKNPEWWDLFTGQAAVAQALPSRHNGTVIPLDLPPYGSCLLVFSGREAPKETVPAVLPRSVLLDLSHDWKVAFEGIGKTVAMDSLRSWTEIAGLRNFSGRATYQRKFDIAGGLLREGLQVDLSLGDPTPTPAQKVSQFQAWLDGPVREAAEVFVNGNRAGTIWHPPYELDVTPWLHVGENELRVVVGNLAVNAMAGRPLPDRKELKARYGERFVDQGTEFVEPLPAGITGRVQLIERSQPTAVRSGP